MTTRTHTLAASLIALMTAAPAIAQQSGTNQQNQPGTTTQQQGQQAEARGSSDKQMPEAATPQGTGLSDVATVDRPAGEIGAQPQQQGEQGRMVVLDVQNFGERIYERGFRQGYVHGMAEARERFATQLEQAQSMREGLRAQQDRAESVVGGQAPPARTGEQQDTAAATSGSDRQMTGEPAQQQARTQGTAQETGNPDDRGTIIVLPPGVTPAMFIEELRRAHESMSRGE